MVQGENNEECFFFFFFLHRGRSLRLPPFICKIPYPSSYTCSLSYSSLIRVNFLITANDRATSGIRLNYYYPRSRSKLIERSFSKDSRKFSRKFCKMYIIFAFFLSSLLKFFSARFFYYSFLFLGFLLLFFPIFLNLFDKNWISTFVPGVVSRGKL